jgi:GR25 family glycosyltransferase involved in LPS biosynthesis
VIDKLYYINLDKRVDRLSHLEESVLPFINVSAMKRERVSATDHTHYNHISRRGAGCSLSHIGIWKDAIANGYDKIIVMEDDFELVKSGEEISEILSELNKLKFSICNLGYSNMSPLMRTESPIFFRCNNIQTTSCYVAYVPFLKVMLPHIEQATERLMNKESYPINAIDQAWKRFQNRTDWLVSERIGKQRSSISDIERRNTDYGV